MFEKAVSLERDVVRGRWVVEAQHRRRRWEIVVEPDMDSRRVVVITAYPVGK
jgi:hypothetical protein